MVALVSIAWRWLPSFEIGPLERQLAPPVEKQEERIPERVTMERPAAPKRMAQVPDEIVLRAIDSGRAAFLGCWKRALNADPMLEATKVKIRVELDAVGTVLAVTHDATNAKLGNCLTVVARSLRYAAPMDPAVAEFPLFFQPD